MKSPTTLPETETSARTASAVVNIAQRLRLSAEQVPWQRAVVFPAGRDAAGRVTYSQLTFRQLDQETDRLARGLRKLGVTPGTRLVLMVPPSLEFISLTFALFKVGAVSVLIDPGMGRSNIFRCLDEVEPQGFVAIPLVHTIRRALKLKGKLRQAKLNVTVGRSLWKSGKSYEALLGGAWEPTEIAPTRATDPAAIIFTSGSTGPPKGVLYEHGMFDAQVELLQEFYQIQPGELDLPGFPLFALFNSAMQVTTVVPDMNPTRPADVDPRKILEAIHNQGITQAFGSPALWNRVGRYCEQHNISIPRLKRVLSAGAPVPVHVLQRMTNALEEPEAEIFTPYGATESLPIASIGSREVLNETAALSRQGKGTCVGRTFPRIKLKIIAITEGPISNFSQAKELPSGEIGEIIVQGPVVTREYYCKPEATAAAKIPDGDSFWHRMGDTGYLDEQGRLWFCGRKAHIVETAHGRMFSIPCEAVFNNHPRIDRSALVGLGEKPQQTPVIVAEPEEGQYPQTPEDETHLREELLKLGQANPLTERIETILFHRSLPVDIRHNVKIFREKLVPWATEQLQKQS